MLEYFKNLFTKPAYMISTWDGIQMTFWVMLLLFILVDIGIFIWWLVDRIKERNKKITY